MHQTWSQTNSRSYFEPRVDFFHQNQASLRILCIFYPKNILDLNLSDLDFNVDEFERFDSSEYWFLDLSLINMSGHI